MKIGSIVTLYYPDVTLLSTLMQIIAWQVDLVCVVDNTPNTTFNVKDLFSSYENLTYIPFGKNVGIAEAQNRGIKFLKKEAVDFVLFLDQDSIPPQNMVKQLMESYLFLSGKGVHVGGVGPRPYNREDGTLYQGFVNKGHPDKMFTPVLDIISSASLVPMKLFDQVGGMESSLFIDFVDQEFCWRASREGYKFFICESIRLNHKVGDGDRSFFFRKIRITSPFRIYFIFRNYLILCRRNYVPFYWKCTVGIKSFVKLFYFPFFVAPRFEYVKAIWRGVKDGIRNKASVIE